MSLGSGKNKPDESRMDRRNRLRDQKAPSRQEKATEKIGGRRQPGSGAGPRHKGDSRFDGASLLMECKTTAAASFRVSEVVMAKITRQALAVGKDPAIEIEIRGVTDPLCSKKWVVLPRDVFARLIGGSDEAE